MTLDKSVAGFSAEEASRLSELDQTHWLHPQGDLGPGHLDVTYFASGGGEANATAYKIARLYWKLRGEPERVNIISRIRDYHGLTYAATSATGLANFWKGFEPLAPGFLHAPAPDPYRYTDEGSAGAAYVQARAKVVLDAGPQTVAVVVAGPVEG